MINIVQGADLLLSSTGRRDRCEVLRASMKALQSHVHRKLDKDLCPLYKNNLLKRSQLDRKVGEIGEEVLADLTDGRVNITFDNVILDFVRDMLTNYVILPCLPRNLEMTV